MKVIQKNNYSDVFPMRIKCKIVFDQYGFAYGNKNDFCGSELEFDAEDIKAHKWEKYSDYHGVDYGVVCPICHQFVVVDEKIIPVGILKSAEEISLKDI